MSSKEELLERKEIIEEEIRSLNSELINIECELERLEDTPLEICWQCEYCYTNNSLLSLIFNDFRCETRNPEEEYMYCKICNGKIKRHPSFSDSLKLMKDDEFLTRMVNDNSEHLSLKSRVILVELVQNLTVPSFVCSLERNERMYLELDELIKKDYVRLIEEQNSDHSLLIANAKKLKLHDDEGIISIISTQREFNTPYIQNKRYERMKNLVNDFTNEDKTNLLHKFNNRCALTGKEVTLHMDHVIPVAWEIEGTTLSNMLPIWDSINSSKHDSNVFEWYKVNGDRFDVKEEMFIKAITYIAELNDMTFVEYKDYVYKCEQIKNRKDDNY